MKNKSGSMELGVNAIVILIIALAILGLGIAFVTNLFGSGSEKLGDIIKGAELPFHADAQTPVKFQSDQVKVKDGKTLKIKVSVYNDGFSDGTGPVDLAIPVDGCIDSSGAPLGSTEIKIVAPGQIISQGEDGGYLAVITVDIASSTPADTYICKVEASDGTGTVTGQLFIEVTL